MRALRHVAPVVSVFAVLLGTLAPFSAFGNPISVPFGGAFREAIVFCLLCLFIVLIEGAVVKLVLFGLDGPSWPRAFALAGVLNLASAIVGGLAGVHFDLWTFEFEPNLAAVLGVSLGVEGGILLVAVGLRRLPRAVRTVLLMNAVSYVVLVMARFPEGTRHVFGGL